MIHPPLSLRFVAVCLIALAACGCSKRSFRMPSGSMIPTFPVGAEVSADTRVKAPARGEVWVFRFPEDPKKEFVKRLVGLPGDEVALRGDTLVVNGKPVPSCTVGAYANMDEGVAHAGRLVLEKNEAAAYLTFAEDLPTGGPPSPWTTAPGEFFAMGDNRRNSFDSRFWHGGVGGGVPRDLLIGRVDAPPPALPPDATGLAAGFAKCKAELGVSP